MSRFGLSNLRSRDQLLAIGKDITDEVKSDDVPSLAAAVAFKIMLALFPALAAAIGIFALLTEPSELERLLGTLSPPAPAGIVEFLQGPLDRLINNQAAGFAAFAGIVGGLWAASSAALTLNKTLSRAYDVGDDRTFVSARVYALAVTAALLLALIGIFVLIVTGSGIENSVLASLPLTDTARGLLDLLSTIARFLLAAVALMLLISFI